MESKKDRQERGWRKIEDGKNGCGRGERGEIRARDGGSGMKSSGLEGGRGVNWRMGRGNDGNVEGRSERDMNMRAGGMTRGRQEKK